MDSVSYLIIIISINHHKLINREIIILVYLCIKILNKMLNLDKLMCFNLLLVLSVEVVVLITLDPNGGDEYMII
jgi:hypothetical protein